MDAVSARTRGRRRPARLAHGLLALAAAWVAAGEARAVELVRPEEALMALFALETQIGMEQSLLAGVELRYQANVEERTRYGARLDRLYGELEAAWAEEEETFDEDAVERGDGELERLEKAQLLAWDEGRRLRREMLKARARLRLLRDQVERLAGSMPSDAESLTGYWDVLFLAGAQRGVFFLIQSGAILTGEYGLEGGYRGSLQGTFVDGQVVLHRIDTRLGRVMDLDGAVSADGESIRGTWRRYDLSGGRPATGAWTATRRVRTPTPKDEGTP